MKKIRSGIFIISFAVAVLFPLTGSSEGVAVAVESAKRYGLDELLAIAAEKNPSVAVFRANVGAASGDAISAAALPNPELEIEGGRGESLDGSESRDEYSVSIGQPLEWPGKRYFRKKAAKAALEAARYDSDNFMLELRFEVKAAFYRLLLGKKEAEIAGENLKTVDELLETVEIRVEAGESPGFELVKARVESLKAAKALRSAEKRVLITGTRLNSLLGNALPDNFDVQGEFSSAEQDLDKNELLEAALEKHPLLLRQKKEAEARGNDLKRERQSRFPDVTVKGFFDRELDKESYGVGLSLPLPLWYRNRGEIATASGELAAAEAELFKARVELSRALEEAYRNYEIALDEIEVYEKGLLRQAEEALEIAEFSYRQGESGLLDYLDAQRVYRETLLDYNRARFDLAISVADIERLSGDYR